MKVTCPQCQSSLNVDEQQIPAGGANIKCLFCQHIFPLGAVPLPGGASRPAPAATMNFGAPNTVPLPGGTGGQAELPRAAVFDETTRAYPEGSVPLPGGTGGLPGGTLSFSSMGSAQPPPLPPSGAVPLPGGSGGLPGGTLSFSSMGGAQPPPLPPSGAVPLPGGSNRGTLMFGDAPPADPAPSFDLGDDFSQGLGNPAVPLPGAQGGGCRPGLARFPSPEILP